jgi:hypothetical protein
MNSSDTDLKDFRSRAVAASEALRRNLPNGVSPEKAGISYCVARQPTLAPLRTPIKATAVACAILGLSGVAAGAIIAVLLRRHTPAESPGLLATALCCSVGGILLMLLPVFVARWIVRSHLAPRDEVFEADSRDEGIHVALEYAPTYGSMKLLAEDVGLMFIHPNARYVRIDGLSYEYVIQSKDVMDLTLHANGKTVLLSYAIGEEQLELAILPRSLRAELERQTVGSSRSLFQKVHDALAPDEGVD